VVTGLEDGATYTFTVKAVNGVGASAPSAASNAIITATVPQAPTAVSASRGNGEVLVSWSPPSSDGGAAITGYDITGEPGDLFATASGAASSLTMTGLSNGTTYTFSVTAHNAVGSGPASAPSNAVTPRPCPASRPA
jgi:hypothetical protein